MMNKIILSNHFKKDLKRLNKRGYDLDLLNKVVTMLSQNKKLPSYFKDHELTGNYKGFRECHIQPDWLLIYKLEKDDLFLLLTRTGTHSDLF